MLSQGLSRSKTQHIWPEAYIFASFQPKVCIGVDGTLLWGVGVIANDFPQASWSPMPAKENKETHDNLSDPPGYGEVSSCIYLLLHPC